jgi:hypothetical protein
MVREDRPVTEIIKKGKAIATCSGSQKVVEAWVTRVADNNNTRLDWMYRAGRVIVYHLGDNRQQVIDELQKTKEGIRDVVIL